MAAHTQSSAKVTPLEASGPMDSMCVSNKPGLFTTQPPQCSECPLVLRGFSWPDRLTVMSPLVHTSSNRGLHCLCILLLLGFIPFLILSWSNPQTRPFFTKRQNSDSSNILDLSMSHIQNMRWWQVTGSMCTLVMEDKFNSEQFEASVLFTIYLW